MKRETARTNSLGWALILVVATTIGSVPPAHSANPEATAPGTIEGFAEPTPPGYRGSDTPPAGGWRSLAIGCVGALAADASISAGVFGGQDGTGPSKAGNALDGDGGPTSRCAEYGERRQDGAGAALRNNFFALIAEIVD